MNIQRNTRSALACLMDLSAVWPMSVLSRVGMLTKPYSHLLARSFLLAFLFFAMAAHADDEFIGPFGSWINVTNAPYNARGDGSTDDTASIQKALNVVASKGSSCFVFLPPGTYLIKETLVMQAQGWTPKKGDAWLFNANLIGANPATTIIKWGGNTNGNLLLMNECMGCRVSRLTLDGGNLAHACINDDNLIPGGGAGYAGQNEFSDLVLKNARNGILAGESGGAGVAESYVSRCTFTHCTDGGLKVCNFNALDWWVTSCLFNGCGVAVRNGAGSFVVAQCVFKNSTVADIKLDNACYWYVTDNYSVGSKMFFSSGGPWNEGRCLQRNIVLDYTGPHAMSLNPGANAVSDNILRSRPGDAGPVITGDDIVSVGNTFTISNTISAKRANSVDDLVVNRGTVNPREPTLAGTLPNMNRYIYEVPPGGSGKDIQAQIDAAARSGFDRPVVHIQAGTYSVSSTLVIPANRNIQIMGDGGMYGNGTDLNWSGSAGQPMLKLAAPSQATIRDIHLSGNMGALGDCIEVESEDSPRSRVFVDELSSSTYRDYRKSGQDAFVKMDSLDNTIVEIRGIAGDPIHVSGGAGARAGNPGPGIVRCFGTDCANFLVDDHGSLLIAGNYSECRDIPALQVLSGNFTLQGSMWKYCSPPKGSVVVVNGSNANASFLGVTFIDAPITVQGSGANSQMFGNVVFDTWTKYTGAYFKDTSNPSARTTLLNSSKGTTGNKGEYLDNVGPADAAAVRSAFAISRANAPYALPLPPLGSGVTDVRIYRIALEKGANGLHVTKSPGGKSAN